MRAALDLFFGERGEPALDEIQPRRARRGEMHMKPRVAHKPAAHARRLVSGVVVQNQMNVEVGRDLRLDGIQKLQDS